MTDEKDDNFDDLESFEIPELDVREIIEHFGDYSSVKLCEIIISDRYLGINPDLALACMEELGKRREKGEVFDFEGYIEKEFSDLPKLDLAIPDLQTVLAQVISGMRK